MRAWAERLATLGAVETLDYDYMREGRKRPDPSARLIARHREALAGRAGVVLAGKSMGSRIGCHVTLEEPVAALVCFGYPLLSPAGKMRDEVLVALRTPILFVQGTRDELCPLDRLAEVRARMTAPNELHIVEGGDHSLQLLKRDAKARGTSQETSDATVLDAVRAFIDRWAASRADSTGA